MKTLSAPFLFSALSLLIISCNDKDNLNGDPTLRTVPFLAGRENIYSFTATLESSDTVFSSYNDSISIRISSTQESIGNYTDAVMLEGVSLLNPQGMEKVWYVPTTDSLIEIAYLGAGHLPVVMPKGKNTVVHYSEMTLPYTIKKFLLSKINLDSVQWRDDPRVVYKFPLSVGKEWVSFRYPFFQTRKVAGYEFVPVKAGQFYCAKIKTEIIWSTAMDTSLTWYDYVSTEGLILRTLELRSISIRNEHDEEIGIAHSTERLELISQK